MRDPTWIARKGWAEDTWNEKFPWVAENGLPHTALIYVADPTYIEDSLLPYTWYKDYVLEGAKEHGFANAYVQTIARVEARRDPDRKREAKERTLLEEHLRGCGTTWRLARH